MAILNYKTQAATTNYFVLKHTSTYNPDRAVDSYL